MILIATDRQLDRANPQDMAGFAQLCALLNVTPHVDVAVGDNGDVMATPEGLAKITKTPEGLGFLSAFCAMDRDMLCEFVMAYNPKEQFLIDDNDEMSKMGMHAFTVMLNSYKRQRGLVH